MNVGYREASKLFDSNCFIFHDVDMIPEDCNFYHCSYKQPTHLSVAVEKFGYKLPYPEFFGGVTALTKKQIDLINGFSNDFWGWGGEDDDAYKRVILLGFKIHRPPAEVGRYKTLNHTHDAGNPLNECRFILLEHTAKRWKTDGLSNLNYRVVDISFNRLFTKIKVDLLQNKSMKLLKILNLAANLQNFHPLYFGCNLTMSLL